MSSLRLHREKDEHGLALESTQCPARTAKKCTYRAARPELLTLLKTIRCGNLADPPDRPVFADRARKGHLFLTGRDVRKFRDSSQVGTSFRVIGVERPPRPGSLLFACEGPLWSTIAHKRPQEKEPKNSPPLSSTFRKSSSSVCTNAQRTETELRRGLLHFVPVFLPVPEPRASP